jgi:predicted enzyme related to lactoylglutathione lyase
MPEMTSYEPGTPCWVELSGTPDVEASEAFYRELFGWEMPELESSSELGGYRRAKLHGRDVAGVSPRMEDGQPTVWATYVSVADAAATLGRVGDLGGRVVVEPMDVRGLGTMAVFTDPEGAACGIWQPGTFAGAELVNEAGSVVWNELNTRDPDRAPEFYGAVFGWDFEQRRFETGDYTTIKAGGRPVGGMIDITGRVPEEVPAHWLAYIATDDTDATVERARGGGGEVPFGPVDIAEVGRIAVLKDPHGAVFATIEPDPAMRSGQD